VLRGDERVAVEPADVGAAIRDHHVGTC
jgi:hypothetical protein